MSGLRYQAKQLLKSAVTELSSEDDNRIKYAALDIRMAIELITYDKALAYKDEFPQEEYDTWAPVKVMKVLLEINLDANSNSILSIGLESSPGKIPEKMTMIGEESVISLKNINRYYNALGSFLHSPNIRKISSGEKVDYAKMKDRCGKIIKDLTKVLNSSCYNITLGFFASFDCSYCNKKIRKRVPSKTDQFDTECPFCKAQYSVTVKDNKDISTKPKEKEYPCPNEKCNNITYINYRDVKEGSFWTCEQCGTKNKFMITPHYKLPE